VPRAARTSSAGKQSRIHLARADDSASGIELSGHEFFAAVGERREPERGQDIALLSTAGYVGILVFNAAKQGALASQH